jgi:hypothetical protein
MTARTYQFINKGTYKIKPNKIYTLDGCIRKPKEKVREAHLLGRVDLICGNGYFFKPCLSCKLYDSKHPCKKTIAPDFKRGNQLVYIISKKNFVRGAGKIVSLHLIYEQE